MYTPTPRQIEVYGLEKTQGQFYEKNEIFAGTFRANIWRQCKATLPGGFICPGYIHVDDEGNCYVWKATEMGAIFVFIAGADDMHQEQSKILDLTILPCAEEPEPTVRNFRTVEKDGGFNDKPAATMELPFPRETAERILAFEEVGLGRVFRWTMWVILFMIRVAVFMAVIFAFKYGHDIIGGLFVLLYGRVTYLAGLTMFVLNIFKK